MGPRGEGTLGLRGGLDGGMVPRRVAHQRAVPAARPRTRAWRTDAPLASGISAVSQPRGSWSRLVPGHPERLSLARADPRARHWLVTW